MNPIDSEILDLLRCPVTGSKLHFAKGDVVELINRRVQTGQLADRSGKLIELQIDAALVNADQSLLMPIRAGVISMAANRTIELSSIKHSQSES